MQIANKALIGMPRDAKLYNWASCGNMKHQLARLINKISPLTSLLLRYNMEISSCLFFIDRVLQAKKKSLSLDTRIFSAFLAICVVPTYYFLSQEAVRKAFLSLSTVFQRTIISASVILQIFCIYNIASSLLANRAKVPSTPKHQRKPTPFQNGSTPPHIIARRSRRGHTSNRLRRSLDFDGSDGDLPPVDPSSFLEMTVFPISPSKKAQRRREEEKGDHK